MERAIDIAVVACAEHGTLGFLEGLKAALKKAREGLPTVRVALVAAPVSAVESVASSSCPASTGNGFELSREFLKYEIGKGIWSYCKVHPAWGQCANRVQVGSHALEFGKSMAQQFPGAFKVLFFFCRTRFAEVCHEIMAFDPRSKGEERWLLKHGISDDAADAIAKVLLRDLRDLRDDDGCSAYNRGGGTQVHEGECKRKGQPLTQQLPHALDRHPFSFAHRLDTLGQLNPRVWDRPYSNDHDNVYERKARDEDGMLAKASLLFRDPECKQILEDEWELCSCERSSEALQEAYVNMGLRCATEKGLILSIVDVSQLSVWRIEEEGGKEKLVVEV